ncbi:hypothetical protein RU639_013571 [Aspergillus parasiticus]
MFQGFAEFNIETEPDLVIHGVQGGSGPAILLIHGFPQTYHAWHHIVDKLSLHYRVIALDLRGYGASSKPAGSDSHIEYSKSVMARDCMTVMTYLGYSQFFVCGHDRGARVAHKLCVDYPRAVRKAIFLDICPTLSMYNKADMAFATAYFHWFFLVQRAPIPETLINLNPQRFFEIFVAGGPDLRILHPDALAVYIAAFSQPETIHAMCEDYRASASVDLEEAKADISSNRHIQCPLRVLYGSLGIMGEYYDVNAEWTAVHATGAVQSFPVECGHYIPEEQPSVILEHIIEFMSS